MIIKSAQMDVFDPESIREISAMDYEWRKLTICHWCITEGNNFVVIGNMIGWAPKEKLESTIYIYIPTITTYQTACNLTRFFEALSSKKNYELFVSQLKQFEAGEEL